MKKIIFAGHMKHKFLPDSTGKRDLKKNIVLLLFIAAVILGAAAGALGGKYADAELMKSLDIVFLTNFQLRSKAGMLSVFTASFAANFIVLLTIFLLGLTLWGELCVILIPLIKGYGYGLTIGYLYSTYGMMGIFYNLLIILPGAFLFSVVVAAAAKESFVNSVRLLAMFFKKAVSDDPRVQMKHYLLSMLWLLFLAALSSAADMLFSLMFSWIFGF